MFEKSRIGGPEKMQENTKPKIGDFVSAGTLEANNFKQGIFVKDNGDGIIVIKDSDGKEILCRAEGARKVPDENLSPGTLRDVERKREELR